MTKQSHRHGSRATTAGVVGAVAGMVLCCLGPTLLVGGGLAAAGGGLAAVGGLLFNSLTMAIAAVLAGVGLVALLRRRAPRVVPCCHPEDGSAGLVGHVTAVPDPVSDVPTQAAGSTRSGQ